ncbi:IclR family transcriptional regulator [Streptomyces boncukensis]|uniref:Glycerol operon regulatory protein n=1 Tax=Streptomyces boncukensis TaxID=2711219 RepID=A0A6G4WZD3_9ACTN|nr:IclR family transcriptional regulator [Streptomyces boncukensis]NGO70363.1 IclR family transcriptional regulator [Streptomyces boncukensis]
MPKDGTDPADAYGASSVANALRTLVYLREREPARLTEVSDYLGVARSTAHRLLSTLRGHGFVEQEPGTRRYRLGPVLLGLARRTVDERTLVRVARPHLERLRDESGETANLLVLDGPDVHFVDGVDGTQPLRVAPRTGDRLPAYGTAGGKALLARLPPDAVRLRYASGLARLTPATLPGLADLEAELARARERGFTLNIDESVADVHAVGAAVYDAYGAGVGALTISAPSTRMGAARAVALAPLVQRAADAVTRDLA